MAISPWWFCSVCGFQNRPRPYPKSITHFEQRDPVTNALIALIPKCEQCGRVKTAEDTDYAPTAV
jgi:hypothetical protein